MEKRAITTPSNRRTTLSTLSHDPTIPFGRLLRDYRLGLVLIAGAGPESASRPLRWVHVSELEDPTPFLPPLTVLLTTGARAELLEEPEAASRYVRRLIRAGVTALGYGIGVHSDRVPGSIISACDEHGLPLFRVPLATAFAQISRTATDMLTAITRDRDLWALDAQRAVTAASLTPTPLQSVVSETASRLGRWVAVLGQSGHVEAWADGAPAVRTAAGITPPSSHIRGPQQTTPPAELATWLAEESARLVRRGVSAARITSSTSKDTALRLQRLTSQGRHLGTLAVADEGNPDAAERGLINLVAALATAALEQRHANEEAAHTMAGVLIELIAAGQQELAERVGATAGVWLPRGSVVVFRCGAGEGSGAELTEVAGAAGAAGGVLFGTVDGAPTVVCEARLAPSLRRALAAAQVAAGVSPRGQLAELATLLGQAARAFTHAEAQGSSGPVDYSAREHSGVVELLAGSGEARQRAGELLAVLRRHDDKYGENLLGSLECFLRNLGQVSRAAAELGVHRHTLRSRLATVQELTGMNLELQQARTELWLALQLAR